MLSLLFALALIPPSQARQPKDPCSARKVASPVAAFVVTAPTAARDSLVSAVVCLRHAGDVKVGSYHGELVFDSTSARVVSVDRPQGGMRVENTKVAGRVNFAGAHPQGFSEGVLLRVQLRLAKPGRAPALKLEMRELNSVAGASLMKQLNAPVS